MSAADHDSQASAEKAQRAQLAKQTAIDDLHWLMGDTRGRRFMRRLLEHVGVYRTSFSTDALAMAFAEGQRNVGLHLVAEINQHCPQRLLEMQRDHLKHERRNDRNS